MQYKQFGKNGPMVSRLGFGCMLRAACPVSLGDSGVQVLIMHTHGTEAYTPTAAEPYRATDSYRTTDSSHNMCTVREFYYPSSDGVSRVYAREWSPEGAARAVLQLAHGICEHLGRYDDFARFMSSIAPESSRL